MAYGRFQCQDTQDTQGTWLARDILIPALARRLSGPPIGGSMTQHAPGFCRALLPSCLPHGLRPPGARSLAEGDALFWQFPARTEAAAWEQHADLPEATCSDGIAHVYLGLPWATWADLTNRHGIRPDDATHEAFLQQVRIGGWRMALEALGTNLRVHTVCQHVYWPQLLPTWAEMGISDVWLSHAPPGCIDKEAARLGLQLHPWRLHAVNWEDVTRREGLQPQRDPAEKPVLASFMGAYADHYPSDIRLRMLSQFANESDFVLLRTGQWHFEQLVYRHQVYGQPLPADRNDEHRDMVAYNRLLSESVFSLCPAGAGPNTLRLWESLAVGSIPVLLGPQPELPHGGSLLPVDWDAIVLRVSDEQLAGLPQRLRAMSLEERRLRREHGLAAFQAVCQQRCF